MYVMYVYSHIILHTLGGFKGSATKGRFRKCDLKVASRSTTQRKQGKGVQQGSGIPNNSFFKSTLYHGPLQTCHIQPPSETDSKLFLAGFAGPKGKSLFRRIG